MTGTASATGASVRSESAGSTAPIADEPDVTEGYNDAEWPDVLVATVGFNPLPVWCAILHYRPQHLVLVHTVPAGDAPSRGTDYRQQSSLPYAEAIRCLLEEWGGVGGQGGWPAGVVVDLVPWSAGPRQVASVDDAGLVAEVRRIVGERPWRLNAESGTKAMTLTLTIEHSRRFPDRSDWQCSVRDGVITTYGGGRAAADTSLLSLDQIARLYGFSHDTRPVDPAVTRAMSAEEIEWRRIGADFEAEVAGRLLPMRRGPATAVPGEVDEAWHSYRVRPANPVGGAADEYTEFDVVLRAGMRVIVVEAKALQADGHRTFGWRRANAAVVFGDHTDVVLVHPDEQVKSYSRKLRPDLERHTVDCTLSQLENSVRDLLSEEPQAPDEVQSSAVNSTPSERPVPVGPGLPVRWAAEPYASEVLVASEGLPFSASRTASGLCPGLRRLIVLSTAKFRDFDKLTSYGKERGIEVEAPQGLDVPTVEDLTDLIQRAGAYGTVHVDVTGGQKITSVPLMQAAAGLGVPVTVLDSTEGRSFALNRTGWDRYISPDLRGPFGFEGVDDLATVTGLLRGVRRRGTDPGRLISALEEVNRCAGGVDDPERDGTPQRIVWRVDAGLGVGGGLRPVDAEAVDDSLWWPPVVTQVGRFQIAFLSPNNDGIDDSRLEVTGASSLGDRVFPALSMVTESFGDVGRLIVLVDNTQKDWAGAAWVQRVRSIPQLEASLRFVVGSGKSTNVLYRLDGALRSFGLAWRAKKD